MNRLNKVKSLVIVLFAIMLFSTSCVFQFKKDVLVTWSDADGTLIEYLKVDADYDPKSKELPADTDLWHYTGWQVVRTEDKIVCTAIREKKAKVVWVDADGTTLKTDYVPYDDASRDLYDLPKDSEEWHYSEWTCSTTAEGFVYTAKRVHRTKYVWKDADGTVLKEEWVNDGEKPTETDLPDGTEKWTYLEWEQETVEGQQVFTAIRLPNNEYFLGNVFQIVLKDEKGVPISTGSGFVLNDEGWFITNNHVMKEGHSAVAFFDIKDSATGGQYTQLNVIGGLYNDANKDFFIGKLEGYSKIKSYYKNIGFTEKYETGEKSYTIGYPNSSVKMEINAGEIMEEYSDIYDKINGVYYVLSDSYIAPGSSGGILINEKFEVVGITTIGLYEDSSHQIYRASGSVPTFVFKPYIQVFDESKLKTLDEIYK